MKDIIFGRWKYITLSPKNPKKFCFLRSKSKIFSMLTKKILNIDHTYFRCKNQAKNKYIIPHKNLKVTITYKKVD